MTPATVVGSPTAARSPSPAAAASPTAAVTPTPGPPAPAIEPTGYPLDPAAATDLVVGEPGDRRIEPGAGPPVGTVSREVQVLGDPVAANASGWNCRVHLEYEAEPAVDWYVGEGTPIYATMDGTATMYINTHINAFDHYAVPREPYIGSPDRPRAPISPFPGPGGGMGLYVSVSNEAFRTDYGHLSLATIARVPPDDTFIGGYTEDFNYPGTFSVPRALNEATAIASWPVRRGDVIGYTGDSGYSEAPHLHYQLTRLSSGQQLCPTNEPGFTDGGWLER